MAQILLAYYGDDFTGSTDALEAITSAGARAVLFLDVPSAEQLAKFPDAQAIGVAGRTRSLSPEEMVSVLRPALTTLGAWGSPHVHYKVCSTFDSSPTVGSIGRVIEEGLRLFEQRPLLIVGGAPALGRYCTFGNLFAREGIGTDNPPLRLDRLPAMQNHPITPMRESDLRRHLAQQTDLSIGLLSVLDLELPDHRLQERLRAIVDQGNEVVLVDAVHAGHVARIGCLLDHLAQGSESMFSIGSSAVETALGAHWQREGRLAGPVSWVPVGPAGPVLVVSGSCSPVTAGQIEWAAQHGFAEVGLDPIAVASARDVDHAVNLAAEAAADAIRSGRSAIVHTCRGSSDKRVAAAGNSAEVLGTALGNVVLQVLNACRVRRLCIAGGDTSSYVARRVGIEALEMIAPFAPGAPLCRVEAPGSPVHGVEMNVKGGQVGRPDYFGLFESGTPRV